MLIREAMQAPTPFELSRFVHMCGGRAVGSVSSIDDNTINCGPSTLPAILYDCTHDNETPTMVLLYILYRKEHLKIHYQMVYYVAWHVLHVLVQEDMMKLYQEHYLLLKKEDYIKII